MAEPDTFLYLSSAHTRMACQDFDPVAAVRDALVAYAGDQDRPAGDADLRWSHGSGAAGRCGAVPARLPASGTGTGIVVRTASTTDGGEHRAGHGLALLLGVVPDDVSCVVAGDHLATLSTASATVAVAHRLAPAGVMTVGILGADPVAEVIAELLSASQPGLVHIAIHDADPARAYALGERMSGPLRRHGVGVTVTASARDAALGANLVVTATRVASGQAEYDWLHRGAVLVNASPGDLSREIVRRCDVLLVDGWPQACAEPRRLLGRMRRTGELIGPGENRTASDPAARRVDAELGQVFGGRHPGRTGRDDVIVVHLVGLDVEDVALASHVYRIARWRGLGVRLPW